ncbi:hypothetical protein IFM89_003296 [Coptis chinensis]|uniref:Uncharacterized protein n=1 Tax=Coptis chinensis TaxID=261450 RepID=A0A835IKQ9_9MAGN|nr:hypothetical protein IFM89_003296 [Coptis chinensis]
MYGFYMVKDATTSDGATGGGKHGRKNIEEDGLGIENFVDAYMGHGIETEILNHHLFLNRTWKQKNPNVKVRREDDWLTGHERRDGSILESARVAYGNK